MTYLRSESHQKDWLDWAVWGLSGLLLYASICAFFRFRRVRSLQAKYGFTTRASLATMTNAQAQQIVKQLACFESPTYHDLSLRLAIFRTYAIEDIAELLITRSDLRSEIHGPKRYEDTVVLIFSFFKFAPDSEYLHKAVARTNHLHSSYIKAGKISNRDLLYTLWTLMACPVEFMRRYEWRAATDMEVAALGTMWKYLGEMMQIDYEAELGQTDWKDGIDFMEHVTRWAIPYEDMAMKQIPAAKQLSRLLLDLLFSAYPRFLQPVAYTGVLVLLGSKMRHAFSLPEPSAFQYAAVEGAMFLRKVFVRYLMLPRLTGTEYVSDPDPKTGRLHSQHYLKEPWYMRASVWARWNPVALMTRAMGGQIPGDGGAAMLPEGFLHTDLGPKAHMGKGMKETDEWERIVRTRVSGSSCPFSMK